MPRPWEIEVEPYPDYVPDRYYVLRVTSTSRSSKPRGLVVKLEHLDQDQDGREVDVFLGPPRPGGRTASFFHACGQNVQVGTTLRPDDCLGKIITACFAPDSADSWRIDTFKPATEHTS